jgi:hypothetical protein
MTQKILGWSLPPESGHYVQFYQSESILLTQLSAFVEDGLRAGETCVLVATKAHLEELDALLLGQGIDIHALQKGGQYVPLDAEEMLGKFMINDMPVRERFFATVGKLVKQSSERAKSLRIYREMVALLWQDGNREAVLMLENLWNELIETHPCNLFCAYPALHFIYDRAVRNEISNCHGLSMPGFATN